MANDLEALRVHLELPKLSILGHSNSASVALWYAAHHPELIETLILIDSQVLGLSAAEDTHTTVMKKALDPGFAAAVTALAPVLNGKLDLSGGDRTMERLMEQILPLYLHSSEKSLATVQRAIAGPISSYVFLFQNAADHAARTDLPSCLNSISAKTLIMVGREDFICPVALSERLYDGISDSSLIVFDESGHLPWMEQPEGFQATLKQLLLTYPRHQRRKTANLVPQ